MTRTPLNPHRTQFEITLNKEKLILNASFTNIARLENFLSMGGMHFVERLSKGDIRFGDVAAIIYCLYDDRDTPGYDYDDIGNAIMNDGMENIVELIPNFVKYAYRLEELDEFITDFDGKDNTPVDEKKIKKKKVTLTGT
jgi:hypothetical protein